MADSPHLRDGSRAAWSRRVLVAILLILSGPWPAASAAEIYRWIDADGRVQYGDKPPADAQAEPVEIGDRDSVSGDLEARNGRRERLLDVMGEQRVEEARAAAEEARNAAARRDQCRTATDQIRQIEDARYLYEPTADPDNPRILDDAERTAYLERARREATRWCR